MKDKQKRHDALLRLPRLWAKTLKLKRKAARYPGILVNVYMLKTTSIVFTQAGKCLSTTRPKTTSNSQKVGCTSLS